MLLAEEKTPCQRELEVAKLQVLSQVDSCNPVFIPRWVPTCIITYWYLLSSLFPSSPKNKSFFTKKCNILSCDKFDLDLIFWTLEGKGQRILSGKVRILEVKNLSCHFVTLSWSNLLNTILNWLSVPYDILSAFTSMGLIFDYLMGNFV